MNRGILYGVSVGTGDPELITVKGLRILQHTKIIAFPEGIGGKLGIAENIITVWLKENQTLLKLNFPYTRKEDVLEKAWNEAAEKVLFYLKQGEDVAFACEGDVNFYSTFTYLALTLKRLDPGSIVKTVPGVCSPLAAASGSGIPLTKLSDRLMVIPALYHAGELERAIGLADVVVLMKFSSVYRQIWDFLSRNNLLRNSYIVERASSPEEAIYRDLTSYPDLKLSYFSILVIKTRD